LTRFWLPILPISLILTTGLILLAFGVGASMRSEGQIAFTSARDGDQDVYLLDISRGILFNLTHTADNEWQSDWSPDGTQMVFVSDRDGGSGDIYTQTVACAGLFAPCAARTTRITTNPGMDSDPAWSPDGEQIVFSSAEFGYNEIFLTDLGRRVPVRLTNNDAVDANPSWSPDGTQIVFSSNRDASPNVDLYVMNTDGSDPHRILETPGNEFSPQWSPDGRYLIYGTFSGDNYQRLALLDSQTNQSTLLLDEGGNDGTPAFSPDGQSLAFNSYLQSGNSEIYTLRLDCAGDRAACARRLTFSDGMDIYPRWRPAR
jgi:TolB protein